MFADGRAESPHKKKSWDLKKLGKLQKILEMLGSDSEVPSHKANFDSCARKSQKLSCKTFHRKIYFT